MKDDQTFLDWCESQVIGKKLDTTWSPGHQNRLRALAGLDQTATEWEVLPNPVIRAMVRDARERSPVQPIAVPDNVVRVNFHRK
jgi:hypothetical protein